MKAVALFWILVFYPPKGEVHIQPFGYETEEFCQNEGKKLAVKVTKHDKRKAKWTCEPVTLVEPNTITGRKK